MITITKNIEKLLVGFDEEQKKQVLGQAWEACCDGEWLWENFGPDATVMDPWKTSDSSLSEYIEEYAIEEVINFVDF